MKIDPLRTLVSDAIANIKDDYTVDHVELRYNSINEFNLCVAIGKFLMKQFASRQMRVSIVYV